PGQELRKQHEVALHELKLADEILRGEDKHEQRADEEVHRELMLMFLVPGTSTKCKVYATRSAHIGPRRGRIAAARRRCRPLRRTLRSQPSFVPTAGNFLTATAGFASARHRNGREELWDVLERLR